MKIRVFVEEDRLKMASILVRNGYKVSQGKEVKPGTKKTYDYFLLVEDMRKIGGESKDES